MRLLDETFVFGRAMIVVFVKERVETDVIAPASLLLSPTFFSVFTSAVYRAAPSPVVYKWYNVANSRLMSILPRHKCSSPQAADP
jgi:hypothetical protein